MKLSPPIAVLAVLAVGLAATASFAPIRPNAEWSTVEIPRSSYATLALWGQDRVGDSGQALTVAQEIEVLTDQTKGVEPAPAD